MGNKQYLFRIGNYVQLYRRAEDQSMTTHRIKSIYFEDIEGIYYLELSDGFKVNLKDGVIPIYLTDEWLYAFEFEEINYDEFKRDDSIISKISGKFFFVITKGVYHPITYVHQLQNFYLEYNGIIL